jgi:catechol 2,3-dioxygenase-like lactoylglutathione lyase family enzyme
MPAHDFDFLLGSWRVMHRKLRERLAGSEEWRTFGGTADCRPVLRGTGNVDRFTFEGEEREGLTLRLFDAEREQWAIHWADTSTGRLDPPLYGRFENGVGVFYGDDTHAGRPIRVRFFWHDLGPRKAKWEQAFSADGGATWETNWIMELERVAGVVAVHHVQLAMPEGREQDARRFYLDVLGLAERPKPPHLAGRGGAWFYGPEAEVHLGIEDEFRPAKKAHPALLVGDLAAVRERCVAAGVEVKLDKPLPGYDRIFVSDPFGNRIELLERLRDAHR